MNMHYVNYMSKSSGKDWITMVTIAAVMVLGILSV